MRVRACGREDVSQSGGTPDGFPLGHSLLFRADSADGWPMMGVTMMDNRDHATRLIGTSEDRSNNMSSHQADKSMVVPTTRSVGKAIHELVLTDALSRSSSRLLPPGPGRSVVVIPEVAIGRGRPDILVVVVSKTALNAYLASGLRVETLTQARALAAGAGDSVARGGKAAKKTGRAWTDADVKRYSTSVFDSLAVEAKLKDWKQAIRQASRFRHLAHRAAIMLPDDAALTRVSPYLHTYDLGFIGFSRSRPVWCVSANKSELRPGASLWLLELAARQTQT